MKVRIGNDLCFLITLASSQYQINVLSVKAYIINTSGVRQCYPTSYNIRGCGSPSYYCYPQTTSPWQAPEDYTYRLNQGANKTASLVPTVLTSTPNQVKVYVPAGVLKVPGTYKLLVVAQVYHQGYPYQLKTISLDYPDAFTLVTSTAEDDRPDTETMSVVDQSQSSTSPYDGQDIYVQDGQYVGNNVIELNMTDGSIKEIDTSLATGWYNGD